MQKNLRILKFGEYHAKSVSKLQPVTEASNQRDKEGKPVSVELTNCCLNSLQGTNCFIFSDFLVLNDHQSSSPNQYRL